MNGKQLHDTLMGVHSDPFKWLTPRTQGRFESMATLLDPDHAESFFYLGGPMTNIPQHNFPRFIKVADVLRGQGYPIVSPAELDDAATVTAVMNSDGRLGQDGLMNGRAYASFLGRDLALVSSDACIGGIFLEGWQHSRGALGETWVLEYLGKDIYEYYDGPELVHIGHRDDRLLELGIDIVGVPTEKPGIATAASRKELHAVS